MQCSAQHTSTEHRTQHTEYKHEYTAPPVRWTGWTAVDRTFCVGRSRAVPAMTRHFITWNSRIGGIMSEKLPPTLGTEPRKVRACIVF